MNMLKKIRHSVMVLALVGALVVPLVAQAARWVCVCDIDETQVICVCVRG